MNTEAESHNRRLSNLRLALGNSDLLRARNIFQELMEHSSLVALTVRDFESISRMLHKHYSSCPSVHDAMVGSRAMAIHAAAKGQLDGLKAYLLLHLKNGDTEGVWSAYDEFATLASVSQSPVLAGPSEDAEDISNTRPPLDPVERPSSHAGAAEVILTVIAAYASQDRFDDAFDRFMATSTNVRLTTPKVAAFCQMHLGHGTTSKKVQRWSEELVLLRLLSRKSVLQSYVFAITNDKQATSLQKLYYTIASECRKEDTRLTVRPEATLQDRKDEVRRRRVVVSPDIWAIFMRGFFQCNRADLAESVWNDVTALGLSPNHHMWTALIDGHGRHGQCDQAMSVWNRMLEAGIEPNEHSYGAMIHAYFYGRRPQEGYALFEQYRTQVGKTPQGKQSLRDSRLLPLYNIVLHGLCTNGMDAQAQKVMQDIMAHGPKPDIVSYNTFLRHYGRIGDMKNLAAVLRALKPANVQPDVHTFTTVLSALYKGGQVDAHIRMIQVMKEMGVQPNVAMYSTIIDFLTRQGGKENFRNAGSLLQMMEHNPDKDCRPNEVTYTGILAGLHRDPTIPVEEVKLYATELFVRMQKNGILPNRTTYHYLIKACLENPAAQGLQMALGYYNDMAKRGFMLTNRTLYVMLSALLRRGDRAIAGEIINDMVVKGHKPDGALATLVQKVQMELALQTGHR
ncbi:hypothetical protein K439DRAFT_1034158 [Ramaria rubella]|nr:hypothetical protein K439DRAFT_1034158 [Ramaria rubella]